MTRINIVPPSELTDQHLVAEYREIFMIGPALQRSFKSKSWNKNKIPIRYTLNKGHVMFFYDKGKYLNNRYIQIRKEMIKRNMNPNPARIFPLEQFPSDYQNDWKPKSGDFDIVRERIRLRIIQRPNWYRYRGKILNFI